MSVTHRADTETHHTAGGRVHMAQGIRHAGDTGRVEVHIEERDGADRFGAVVVTVTVRNVPAEVRASTVGAMVQIIVDSGDRADTEIMPDSDWEWSSIREWAAEVMEAVFG